MPSPRKHGGSIGDKKHIFGHIWDHRMRVYNIVYDIFGGFGGMGLQDILSSKILEVSSMASSSCRDRSSTTSCGQTHESWLNHPPKQRSIELDDFAKKPPCVQGFQEVPMFEDTEGYPIF